MKPQNLVSVYQGAAALEKISTSVEKKFKVLKSHEIRNLNSMCNILQTCGCNLSDFDGFFVGYTIGQIGKEFDLLTFGFEFTINIEIKSELKVAKKEEKILKQLRVNNYYLRFLGRPLRLFTYVDNDGFYEYIVEFDSLVKTAPSVIATCLRKHRVDYSVDPDREFIPSNYLVSPFNSTDKFISGEYFLTTAQQKIKEEITLELQSYPFMYFSISANAGTGKTLMMYDIAKDMIQANTKVMIIHCGIVNGGHERLRDHYGWSIRSISSITPFSINNIFNECEIVFIDEAQRIREHQLEWIIEKTTEKEIPVVFSYDVKQYLKSSEGRDIETYLRNKHPSIRLSPKRLTTKIRTNKEMASFITNLLNIGSSRDHLNYEQYIQELKAVLSSCGIDSSHKRKALKSECMASLEKQAKPYNTISANAYNILIGIPIGAIVSAIMYENNDSAALTQIVGLIMVGLLIIGFSKAFKTLTYYSDGHFKDRYLLEVLNELEYAED